MSCLKDENVLRLKEARDTLEEARENSSNLKLKFRVDSALEELEKVIE